MNCSVHTDKESVGVCNGCGRPICAECHVPVNYEHYCKQCVANKINVRGAVVRSPALAACMSVAVPGLGQVYNRQFRKALVILATSVLVFPWVLGIIDAYKTAQRLNTTKENVPINAGCIVAFVVGLFVSFYLVIIIGIVLAIAIPTFVKHREIAVNEQGAEATVRGCARAAEAYAAKHNGAYPSTRAQLDAFLENKDTRRNLRGYSLVEEYRQAGYTLQAIPARCRETGEKIFVITTHENITVQDCTP